MDTEPSMSSQAGSPLRTADELFAHPECVHIVSMNNSSQNIHLERTNRCFRLTFGASGAEPLPFREFRILDELYEARELMPMRVNWRDAIWQDISDYPPFSYSALYRPLGDPIELAILPDSEQITVHGPYVVYGPVDITTSSTSIYAVTPKAGWLVVEHPAFTIRGRGGRAVLRVTHNFLDRLRLKAENYRLRHDKQIWTHVRPGVTVIYGKPPANWQTMRQVLPGDRSVPMD